MNEDEMAAVHALAHSGLYRLACWTGRGSSQTARAPFTCGGPERYNALRKHIRTSPVMGRSRGEACLYREGGHSADASADDAQRSPAKKSPAEEKRRRRWSQIDAEESEEDEMLAKERRREAVR